MTDNTDKDKKLLENLDRVLEERDDEITGPLDEDTSSALDFARKMVSLREEPDKEFAENLKARLVHRLAEQEKTEESSDHDLVFWGVPRRKLWQGTIAALIVIIILVIILIIILLTNSGPESGMSGIML